jgi:hypothetical protein
MMGDGRTVTVPQGETARAIARVREPSPIQTLTVGPGVSPDLRIAPLAGYTAGGDFHPAPKVSRG